LMASGRQLDHAVQVARDSPKLSVGCHVVLVDGTPISDPRDIPSLMDRTDATRFRQSLSSFASSALAGRIDPAHVEAEATAQIRRLQAAGIKVSHLDTHKHSHVFPAVLMPLLGAARKCGIRATRNPFVARPPLRFSELCHRAALVKRYVQVTALRALWASRFRAMADNAGIATPDGSFGVIETGHLDQELFEAFVKIMPEGTWELVCHPGYNDAELAGVHTRLRESRTLELQVLTSPGTRDLLDKSGIEIISYNDLVPSPSR